MRIRPGMLALLATLFILPIVAQDSEISFKSTQLAPGLYMLEGEGGFAGGNISLSTGEDGVVLIDDGLPPLTGALLEALGKLTEDPVKFLINTFALVASLGMILTSTWPASMASTRKATCTSSPWSWFRARTWRRG